VTFTAPYYGEGTFSARALAEPHKGQDHRQHDPARNGPDRLHQRLPKRRGAEAVIPHDRAAYRERHLVDNLFCRIKDFTRIVLRKCKTTRSYAGFVSLAFTLVNLQLCP
jgi:transposase